MKQRISEMTRLEGEYIGLEECGKDIYKIYARKHLGFMPKSIYGGKLHASTKLDIDSKIWISEDSVIGENNTIGSDVMIGFSTETGSDVTINDGAIIGYNVVISCGVTVARKEKIYSNSIK